MKIKFKKRVKVNLDGIFNLKTKTICKIPKYPKSGNKKFTKLEKPIGEKITLLMHKIAANCGKYSLFKQILFKKLMPKDIAVVKIAAKIIKPYKILNSGNLWFIT